MMSVQVILKPNQYAVQTTVKTSFATASSPPPPLPLPSPPFPSLPFPGYLSVPRVDSDVAVDTEALAPVSV